MGQILTFIILFLSLGGVLFILYRKIPLLKQFPREDQGETEDVSGEAGGSQRRVVSSQRVRAAASQNLNRTLSTARSLASKTEGKSGEVLKRLRKGRESRKEDFSESYREQFQKKSDE